MTAALIQSERESLSPAPYGSDARIAPHNRKAASVWSSGGAAYEEISRQIASALDH
jgi:hypothetical protein